MAKQPKQLQTEELVELDINVVEAAKERMLALMLQADTTVVSCSGGKDSTVLVELAVMVAKENGLPKPKVLFWDEEAIWTETVNYMMRMSKRDDIEMHWMCIPIECRNACSRKEPLFFPWHPDEKRLWLRDPPEHAIFNIPEFQWGMKHSDIALHMWPPQKYGNVISFIGMRADESLRRRRIFARAKKEAYCTRPIGLYKNVMNANPIYDWSVKDVWKFIADYELDYNPIYDTLDTFGVSPSSSRICALFTEEGISSLHHVAPLDPALWDKLQFRVSGAATAARYGHTSLYNPSKITLEEGQTYEELMWKMLYMWGPKFRQHLQREIAGCISAHQKRTKRPIPEKIPDPLTGASWEFLCKLVKKGDWKGRTAQTMMTRSTKTREKMGMTTDDVNEMEEEEYEYINEN